MIMHNDKKVIGAGVFVKQKKEMEVGNAKMQINTVN